MGALIASGLIAYSLGIRYVLPFFTVYGNVLLGIFVLLNNRKNMINVSYAVTALLTALWALLIILYNEAATPGAALIWIRSAAVVYAYIPIPFIYFFSVFPKEDVVPKKYQMVAWFCVATFFALTSMTDLIIKNVQAVKEGFTFVPGPAFALFCFYFLGFLFFAFSRLIEKYYEYRGLSRRQIAYVLLGFFLGFIFPVITNMIMPLFGYLLLAGIGPFSTVITVGFISYAITKSHLMDMSVVISRAVAEVLTVLFHGTIYLGLVWFYRTYVSTSIDLPFVVWTVLYGILVGQTHQSIRISFQTTSDKLFLRGRYDYYKALSDASSSVGEKLSRPDILRVLYRTFHEVLEVANPRVLLPENFTEIDKALMEKMISGRKPIWDVKELDAALLVPCLLEDRLIAVFALGPKLSEDHYTDEDLRLLTILANQVAITLDHARSYEKIKADLEAAEKQLTRSQRLASLGTLTAGVTHEIRNPLTVIRAETERLANEARDLEYLKQFRELVLKHIDRIAGIVQRMLGLAKENHRREVDVNLSELIDSTLQFFAISRISVEKDLRPVTSIKGDLDELQEVFVNLIQNAIEAMTEGGTLSLKSHMEGGKVVVEVSDTGKGIPEEIRERIFDPFFSTRHEGAGLGLSIVYRIVRQHGGDIKVTSEAGKGTTFRLSF